jgi:ATP adenylyltransferase
MIVPKRHCLSVEELRKEEMEDLFQLLQVSTQILKKVLQPHGFNIGINMGKAGGAGEEHIHIHIVPRWNGDTNFMPVLIQTKVVPEYLEKTYQKLHPSFTKLSERERGLKGGQKK